MSTLLVVAMGKAHFVEEFGSDWESRWTKTTWKAEQQGTFVRTQGEWFGNEEMAYGIRTTGDLKYFELSARLPKPVTTGKAPLVIQYSVKFEKDVECGGAYLKLVGEKFDATKFGGDTPLLVMFGPDICGNDNKIHLILDHKTVGYLWKKKPASPNDKLTHIYTAVLYPNSSYAVYLDAKMLENGTVADDWEFSAPKFLPDPNDTKPLDWNDLMYIDDPNSTKPTDWEDEEMIEDKDATKPEDWDEAKEGEWKPPKTKNPKYKGPWVAKKVYNQAYKGVWKAKTIPNPNYTEVAMDTYTIGGLGIDVWQTRAGTVFDNIMLTDSLDEALAHAKKVLELQVAKEKEFKAEYDKEEEKRSAETRKKLEEAQKAAAGKAGKEEKEEPNIEGKEDL